MKRPCQCCAKLIQTLTVLTPGIAHGQQRDIDSYDWINDFVLADINDDGLFDFAATNHGFRSQTQPSRSPNPIANDPAAHAYEQTPTSHLRPTRIF